MSLLADNLFSAPSSMTSNNNRSPTIDVKNKIKSEESTKKITPLIQSKHPSINPSSSTSSSSIGPIASDVIKVLENDDSEFIRVHLVNAIKKEADDIGISRFENDLQTMTDIDDKEWRSTIMDLVKKFKPDTLRLERTAKLYFEAFYKAIKDCQSMTPY